MHTFPVCNIATKKVAFSAGRTCFSERTLTCCVQNDCFLQFFFLFKHAPIMSLYWVPNFMSDNQWHYSLNLINASEKRQGASNSLND